MGDSQAALFSQRCVETGMAKATFGTGSSVLMNVGSKPISGKNGLVSALAWKLTDDIAYALEGIIHTTGDCLKWAKDNLNLFDNFAELESLADSVADSDGVYVIPAFVGLGAPYWDANARASFVGMSRSTNRCHILRACLDSIAYQIRDVVDLMTKESGIPLYELRADGEPSRNKTLMHFQAEMLASPVVTSNMAELSAMGAAYAGGLGTQFWTKADLDRIYQKEAEYSPTWEDDQRSHLYRGWQTAVKSVLDYSIENQK